MSPDQLNSLDRFAAHNSISLSPDAHTATLHVAASHLNAASVCQGGALFTLADLAAAGLTRGEQLTVDSTIQFLRPAFLGDTLTATATFIHPQTAPSSAIHTPPSTDTATNGNIDTTPNTSTTPQNSSSRTSLIQVVIANQHSDLIALVLTRFTTPKRPITPPSFQNQ